MPTAHGVKVWVEVDGSPLPEHKLITEGRRTTCYIPIPNEAGKKFCVRFNNTDALTGPGLSGSVYLDGLRAGGAVLRATSTRTVTVKGRAQQVGYLAPFIFSRLHTTEDEGEACHNVRRLRDLGTIRVKIKWALTLEDEAWHPPSNNLQDFTQPIHESSKKGPAYCATLGELETSKPHHRVHIVRSKTTKPAEYVFKYAPLDWLHAKGIVSRPVAPSPTPGPSKRSRDSSTLTLDNSESETELLDPDEAETYKRLKAKIAQGSQNGPNKRRRIVKKENDVKEEPGPSPLSGRKNGHPTIIDLTGGD